MPPATSSSARSVAPSIGSSAAGRHALEVEGRGLDHPRQRAEGERGLVDGVEQWLLVLLQVTVVRERQALQRREEAGDVTDRAAGLAACELGDVGVLLLRHHRAAGRMRVVEHREPELGRRPQHPLLAQPREMHAEEREVEQRLSDEVSVAHRVERVLERRGEAEVGCGAMGIERQRRPGERARAQGRDVEALDRSRAGDRRRAPAPSRARAGDERGARAARAARGCSRAGTRRRRRSRDRGAPAATRRPAPRRPGARACTRAAARSPPGRFGSGPCGASRPRGRRSR